MYIQTQFIVLLIQLVAAFLTTERLLYEDKSEAKDALLQSLNMLVTKGKERTVMEYKQLLEKHGYNHTDMCDNVRKQSHIWGN